MKLNIEKLAREAGMKTDLWRMGSGSLVYTEGCHGVARAELEAFARLIVERCAQECQGIAAGHTGAARRLEGNHATHAAGQRDGANECGAAIRNLLEN